MGDCAMKPWFFRGWGLVASFPCAWRAKYVFSLEEFPRFKHAAVLSHFSLHTNMKPTGGQRCVFQCQEGVDLWWKVELVFLTQKPVCVTLERIPLALTVVFFHDLLS